MRRFSLYVPWIIFALFTGGCYPGKQLKPAEKHARYYTIDSTLIKDKAMNLMVAGYKAGLDSLMDRQIGSSEFPLTKAQPDCTMGYLIADAMMYAVKPKDTLVAAAISNQGGIRIDYLPPGPLTLGNIFEIMPFDNMVVVLEVPGVLLKQWCEYIASRGGWPVSGIHFAIEQGRAKNVVIGGKALNEQLVYRIATSDYIANGGDDCSFLKDCKRYSYNILLRDAMVGYIEHHQAEGRPLSIKLENRISYGE